jgi:hypothetical protein
MKQTTSTYFLLSLIIGSSFLALRNSGIQQGDPYTDLNILMLLTPGILYSSFIIFIQRHNWPIGKLILSFFCLLILYCVSIYVGLISWGMAVPFVGGIGAFIIRKLFYKGREFLDSIGKDYLIFCFAAGLGGWFLSFFLIQFILQDFWTTGLGMGMGVIVLIWQLVFGILWIRDKDLIVGNLDEQRTENSLQQKL